MRTSKLAFAPLVLAITAIAASCADPAKLAAGAACEQATDCDEGLVCVPQKSGARICSSDLDGLGKVPTLPSVDAGAGDDDDATVSDASDDSTTITPPPVDAGHIEASTPPPPPVDSGPPPVIDAGDKDVSAPPPVDAASE